MKFGAVDMALEIWPITRQNDQFKQDVQRSNSIANKERAQGIKPNSRSIHSAADKTHICR